MIICLQLFVLKLLIFIESVPASLLFGIDSVAGAVVADKDEDDDDDGNGNEIGDFIESTLLSRLIFGLSIDNDRVALDRVSSIIRGVSFSIDSELVKTMSGVKSFGRIDDDNDVLLMTVTIEPPVDSSTTVSATG